MKKRIAIVTGASGGLGKEFVALMQRENVDEIWGVARNTDKLDKLKAEIGSVFIGLPLDLSEQKSIFTIHNLLEEQQPEIVYLINNAAAEKMGSYQDDTVEENYKMINLNCSAVVSMCTICIPYMKSGAHILNMSSQSSFQPVPYLNLYSASKVFVRNYTRSLNVELKGTGMTATAVCPGWTDTDMLIKEHNGQKIKSPGLVSAKRVAEKALTDAKNDKDMSVCTLYVKYMHLLTKIFPQKMIMKTWVGSVKKYL